MRTADLDEEEDCACQEAAERVPRLRGETAATGLESRTSTFVRLERGGLPGTGDDGLGCQASAFGLDPGSEGQPKELLAEGRT